MYLASHPEQPGEGGVYWCVGTWFSGSSLVLLDIQSVRLPGGVQRSNMYAVKSKSCGYFVYINTSCSHTLPKRMDGVVGSRCRALGHMCIT